MSVVGTTAPLESSFLPSIRAAGGLAPGLHFPTWKEGTLFKLDQAILRQDGAWEEGVQGSRGESYCGSENASYLLCVPRKNREGVV